MYRYKSPAVAVPFATARRRRVLNGMGATASYITANGSRVSYQPSPGLVYPDGTLLRATELIGTPGGDPVYVLLSGMLHWVSGAAFSAYGYSQGSIKNVPLAQLQALPQGDPITVPGDTQAPPTPYSSVTPAATYPVSSPPVTILSDSTSGTAAAVTSVATAAPAVPASAGNYVYTDPTTGAEYYTDPTTGQTTLISGAATLAASASTSIDLSSPSTWPTWLWLALAAAGTWFVVFKKK
jgi:hypothetical protein